MTVIVKRLVFVLVILPSISHGVIPQRYINEVYPVDDTIASFTKVINAQRLQGTALADIYRERGTHYAELRHYDKAIFDFSRAIELNNNYVTAYINRANAYAKLEQYKQAYQDFAVAQKLSPKNTAIYAIRGSLNFLLGRFKDASNDYKYYLSLKPDDMYRMLWLHLSQKYQDKTHASELAKYSKDLNLNVWPGALLKLYMGKVTAKDFMNAFKKNINKLEPQYLCEGFYYVGQYFLLTGQRNLAAQSFKQAINSNAKSTIEYEFALAYYSRLTQQ